MSDPKQQAPESGDPSGMPSAAPRPTSISGSVAWQRFDLGMTFDHAGRVGEDYVVVFEEGAGPETSERQQIVVRDRAGAMVLEVTSPAPPWWSDDVHIDGRHLVVKDMLTPPEDPAGNRVRLRIYDVTSGELLRRVEAGYPEIDVDDGQLVYAAGAVQQGMCVRSFGLRNGSESEVACTAPGTIAADLALNAGRVGYSELVGWEGRESRCKSLDVVVEGEVVEVPLRKDCGGWSVAVTEGAVAWDETDPSSEWLALSSVYVRPDGGEVEALGRSDTDTLVGCGGRFFWQVNGRGGSRIDMWSPEVGVRTVWGPERRFFPALLECSDGRWLSATASDDPAMPQDRTHLIAIEASTLP